MQRTGAQIYLHPDEPLPADWLKPTLTGQDFSEILPIADMGWIREDWKVKLEKAIVKARGEAEARGEEYDESKPPIWFKERGNTALHDTKERQAPVFHTTDFRVYNAISNNHDQLSDRAQDMRVGAVGVALYTNDGGHVLIQRRYDKASHVPGSYDSSAAGLAEPNGGTIDFKATALEKLRLELKVEESDLSDFSFTGLHSVGGNDYSGMATFSARSNLNLTELDERADSTLKYKGEKLDYAIIRTRTVPGFIRNNYTHGGPDKVCPDGAMTLAASLPQDLYEDTLKRLKGEGVKIEKGTLDDGFFLKEGHTREDYERAANTRRLWREHHDEEQSDPNTYRVR
tara:strand:+ start:2579 stop:3607 length:1029 start_codon:yes stop_codon:yes gene_type:complete